MKRLIIILIILITISIFASDVYDYVYNVAKHYGVNHTRADLIAKTVEEEYIKYPDVPYQIFTALIVSETGFKNIFGDNGLAIGYCQIHEASVWYVIRFYPDLQEWYRKIGGFKELIKYPRMQIVLGYRYLHLILEYITNGNIINALNYWNNSDVYYLRVFDILLYIEAIRKE